MTHPSRLISLTDRSSIGEARRAVLAAAERLGFNGEAISRAGIVATEAATNVIVHAGTGDLLVCPAANPNGSWLDLLALDNGPGIGDVARASTDGFSSAGTAGEGLGAIHRQSTEVGLYTQPDRGTTLWARLASTGKPASYGVLNIPTKGETACGDSFSVAEGATRSLYMVVDGLGHGPLAAEAAAEAVAVTEASIDLPASEILLRSHDALKKTRGAAMSVAIVDHERGVLVYAGIGNVSASITSSAQSRSLISQNGTVGVALPRQVQEYQYPFEPGAILLMFSDGLNTRTTLTGYAGLQNRHPQLVAGVLFRDFSRKRDDATVLVARLEGPRL